LNAFYNIFDKYGDNLNLWVTDAGTYKNKTIAAMVIYGILLETDDIYMDDSGGWGIPVDPEVNDAVADVLANYAGYTSPNNFVTELVYLTADEGDNYSAQPQIVPIFGCPKPPPPVDFVIATGLNWNNGKVKDDKDGANGAGLNQFTVDGMTLKNNKNYLTPASFLKKFDIPVVAAPGSKDEKAYFTLIERNPLLPNQFNGNGAYKEYDVYVALYKSNQWTFYVGEIIVDNPGGNDDKQQLHFERTYDFNRIK
jgi:hypothetical protein